MRTVLITGARAPIALEMARSFSGHGCRVIMADSLSLTIARWSGSVDKYYKLPSPRYNTAAFVGRLQEIIEKEKVSHLVPTCEEAIFIAFHKNKFDCKVWTCDKGLINSLHNKHSFFSFRSEKFPIPDTVLVREFADWDKSDEFVFKPVYSRFATSAIIGKRLRRDYFTESDAGKWIAQKRIRGREICVYSIWDGGVLKAYCAYHPLFRAGKGAGVFFEPVNNPTVYEMTEKFGKNHSCTGQLCFDVIIDENEKPWFIECNPRGTSGAHLIHEKLAKSFLENGSVSVPGPEEYSIKYAMALLHPLSFFKKRVRRSKDVIFDSKDLKPFFLQFLSLLEITMIKLKRRTSWLEATTGDIECNANEN